MSSIPPGTVTIQRLIFAGAEYFGKEIRYYAPEHQVGICDGQLPALLAVGNGPGVCAGRLRPGLQHMGPAMGASAAGLPAYPNCSVANLQGREWGGAVRPTDPPGIDRGGRTSASHRRLPQC